METVLEALPDQPLTAEDIATLNEATTVRLIPYTWYGEQVIAVLLLHDERQKKDERAIEDATGTDSESSDGESGDDDTNADDSDAEGTSTGFGTSRTSTVGTVEVLEDDSLSPNQSSDKETERNGTDDSADDTSADGTTPGGEAENTDEEDLEVYAVGYDDSAAGWVVISQIDPDAELTDAEPLIREWIGDRYHDQIVDKLAVGPSEYELGDTGQ